MYLLIGLTYIILTNVEIGLIHFIPSIAIAWKMRLTKMCFRELHNRWNTFATFKVIKCLLPQLLDQFRIRSIYC